MVAPFFYLIYHLSENVVMMFSFYHMSTAIGAQFKNYHIVAEVLYCVSVPAKYITYM